MELKRPFADKDWEATPETVREYIIQLEDIVLKLFMETEDLKKEQEHSKPKGQQMGGADSLLQTNLFHQEVAVFSDTDKFAGFIFQRSKTRSFMDLIRNYSFTL